MAKRAPNLAGTNLSIDPRTGNYFWRRMNELTGKRMKYSTRTRILKVALAKSVQFEKDYQDQLVGLMDHEDLKFRLDDQVVGTFLKSLRRGDENRRQLSVQLTRALDLLRLRTVADLQDFGAIERRMLRIEGDGEAGTYRRKTLLRCFQKPLKQFSRYLRAKQLVDRDYLADWQLIRAEGGEGARRAMSPEEFARALAAADVLDTMLRRSYASRPIWTALLIAAPRITALAKLDVRDFDADRQRLKFKGNGIKRAGAGMLDSATAAEISAYVAGRARGPLFLAPEGARLQRKNSLRNWMACVSLAAVDLEWPADLERDLDLAYLVHLSLLKGRVVASRGGPTGTALHGGTKGHGGRRRPGAKVLARRADRQALVAEIAEDIQEAYAARLDRVDQHCLRTTHRTWAMAADVSEGLIDRQLGHASPGMDEARKAAWSVVGRKHYTDHGRLTPDARRSAEAVRGMLDSEVAELAEIIDAGGSCLGKPQGRVRKVVG